MRIGKLIKRPLIVLVLIPMLSSFSVGPGLAQPAADVGAPAPVAQPPPAEESLTGPLEIGPTAPSAFCTDSPTGNDGNPLDECQGTSFTLGGDTWDLSVYYTLDTGAGDDWINSHAEATPIVGWMQDAFEAYYEQTGRTYGSSVCSRHIRAKVMKGDGWAGIAWWPNSCYIGLDAPMIRGGGGRGTTMHEMRHKVVQFAYPNCLDDWDGDYPGKTIHIVEGDADYGPSTVGDFGYLNTGYDTEKSLDEHGYNNLFIPYYSEHVDLYAGPFGSPGDPDYLAGGMVEHWEECEAQGELYVIRDVVQHFTPFTAEEFFLNYYAALYLHAYADPATQPELYVFEEDAPGVTVTYVPALEDSVTLASGSKSWNGESTPDTWAGNYYEIQPQAGCDYIMLEGSGSGSMGWAFMAADTTAPSAEWSGWVGSEFSRVFAAYGAHDKIGVAAVAFGHNRTYDLTATCVTPHIEIERPLNPNFVAYVGDPTSPVAFMGYLKVTDGSGTPVTGIPPDWFVLDAEGDAVTNDTISEITKGHYFGIFLPPTKPVGTSWVDLQACLGTSGICDENTEALLYVPPGNMDMVLLHDASRSMMDVDVPGDFSRLEQAKHAAELLVMLAQVGDYYGIMDFSAEDDPPGCAPNCPHDVRIVYPKTEITNPSTQILAMQTAISGMTYRDWTNLGEGLRQAQLEVLGTPYSDNNKVVTVLSDGEENINPMYDDISADIEVVVNTMGFSGDAPNDLLARIAVENGGDFLYVPTTSGGALASAAAAETDAERQATITALVDKATSEGFSTAVATQFAEMMAPASTYLPGGLGLREAYDYRQADATGASRILSTYDLVVPLGEWREESANVSAADNKLTLVSSSKEPDYDDPCGWNRDVEVRVPGSGPRDWIPISPLSATPPAGWDVRNGTYHDVLYVSNPAPGTWYMRTRVRYIVCQQSAGMVPTAPEQIEGNFIQTGKVLSTIKVEGEILLENHQGKVGDPVPILGTVLTRAGAQPGALVAMSIERPGADVHTMWLFDDGQHGDGAAADGIHGNTYTKAVIGGAYNVTIGALGLDPYDPSQALLRMWKGSFYMEGPGPGDDEDDDRIPTWWERQYPCMDPTKYDSQKFDYDQDGLTNWDEWLNGTDPCDPDTDDGGEMDGSEVAGQRNPHWPNDDVVPPIYNWSVRPLNKAILIRWSRPISYTNMHIFITLPTGAVDHHEGGTGGTFTVTLENDLTYEVWLQGQTEDGAGAPTAPEMVTPKADPDAPSGDILINSGVISTTSRSVELMVRATDIPIEGMPAQASGTLASRWTVGNDVSDGVEMRFRNEDTGPWTDWQPFEPTVPWTLAGDCRFGTECTVYGQFRDSAMNESLLVADTITLVGRQLYLPLVMKLSP
ncbi:MAG: VWA domain-containing protein [Anaerolineae bacterium]|nr:VWA domain-containing protein [Anaerolineae bacterium]